MPYNLRMARNPFTPPSNLAFLSTDGDWRVRRYVAKHPHTPQDDLVILSQDVSSDVRWAAIKNPGIPYGIWFRVESYARTLP